jgi:GDP-D-mannose 3', 5'-epimerase
LLAKQRLLNINIGSDRFSGAFVNLTSGALCMRKSAIVCGAGGFIASHLVKRLKTEGYWVRGVDIKRPGFSASAADDFKLLDLRKPESCVDALTVQGSRPDEVYQLAADMGGMGFIHSAAM